MPTLHLLPTDSAGGSMTRALSDAGLPDTVLAMPDDLSCGPISTGEAAERVAWWAKFLEAKEAKEAEKRLSDFWSALASTSDRVVLWFSRKAANELAFFHACAERLGDRSWFAVDIGQHGRIGRVSLIQPESFRVLFGREQALSTRERTDAIESWRRLRSENAPFRVVAEGRLTSAPVDHFDAWLLANAGESPRRALSLVASAMSAFDGQVGNVMLEERLAELVAAGALLADGELHDLRSVSIRRPPSG